MLFIKPSLINLYHIFFTKYNKTAQYNHYYYSILRLSKNKRLQNLYQKACAAFFLTHLWSKQKERLKDNPTAICNYKTEMD